MELRDYLQVLRRRKWTILLATALVVGVAVATSLLRTPVYRATAELLLQQRETEALFDPSTGNRNDPSRAVQTEIEVLKSQPVRAEAAKRLGGRAPKVSASQVGETDVVEVSVRSADPDQASAAANAYAEAYIDFRLKQAVNSVIDAVEQIQGKVTDLRNEVTDIDKQIAGLPAAQRATQEPNLRAQQDALIEQQTVFKQKLDQLQVEQALKSGGAQLVTRAEVPTIPVEPRPVRTGVLALALGLVLGTGLAFLFDYLDDSIKRKEDVERVLPDLPVLGLVPAVATWKEREKPFVISKKEPTSAAAEAYRSLRTSVQFVGLDRPLKTLQVTSPSASEGKTTTLANLAVALARAGQRVVVIDCDLRRPRIHDFFGARSYPGFTSVLLGDVSLSNAIQTVPGEDRLVLLPSGPIPPNPSELLGGRRTVELLTALQGESDIVLIDSPPVLPVTDAAVLAGRIDATLLVATAGTTTQKALSRAVEVLRQVDAPLIGVVLNGVTDDEGYGYSYQYRYYRPEPTNGRRQSRTATGTKI